MREDTPSRTAALVAFFRGLSPFLPTDVRLVSDPLGMRLAGSWAERAERVFARSPKLTWRVIDALEPRANVLWMQLRTRAIDDAIREFVAAGGRQVLLLGAGFDSRATRLVDELAGSVVFEVDHPATQGRKRQVIGQAATRSAPVKYLAWNFERDPLAQLPARLAEVGHDPNQPTLTVWEGVTMYLTEAAIDATLEAVRSLSAPGSRLVFTYISRDGLRLQSLSARFVAALGEPWTYGFEPTELPAFLAQRGYQLVRDDDMRALSQRWFPARFHNRLANHARHVAIAAR